MNYDCYNITLETLRADMIRNREIEFELKGHPYFAQPCTDAPSPVCYQIWDVVTHECVFQGGLKETLAFAFPGGYALQTDFEEFDILYIL